MHLRSLGMGLVWIWMAQVAVLGPYAPPPSVLAAAASDIAGDDESDQEFLVQLREPLRAVPAESSRRRSAPSWRQARAAAAPTPRTLTLNNTRLPRSGQAWAECVRLLL